jgi:zinc transport system substrate-binding protein
MFKKIGILVSAVILTLSVLTGCTSSTEEVLAKDKVNVVTSFYPLYDFARKIGGDHVNVINLIPAGIDPHHWSPKSRDIKLVSDSELFLYQGVGLEGWVDDFLQSLHKDAKVKPVKVSDGATLIPISGEHNHDAHDANEASHANDGEQHREGEWDPHLWLSPMNAKKMAENIKNALIEVDEAHKADYEANYNKLAIQFDELDVEFKNEISKLPRKEIVVAHQAFGYLAHDYGLEQKAIMGISAEAEPTAQDMMKINKFIREHQVKYIFFEDLVSDKLAKTIARDTNVETLVLHTLEGLTDEQSKNGEDYFSMMRKNLNNIVKALQ